MFSQDLTKGQQLPQEDMSCQQQKMVNISWGQQG